MLHEHDLFANQIYLPLNEFILPQDEIVHSMNFRYDRVDKIIALCATGLHRIIIHLATGSERRSGALSSSRRESALTTLPKGEAFYHDLICFAMSLRRSRQDVSCLGDVQFN